MSKRNKFNINAKVLRKNKKINKLCTVLNSATRHRLLCRNVKGKKRAKKKKLRRGKINKKKICNKNKNIGHRAHGRKKGSNCKTTDKNTTQNVAQTNLNIMHTVRESQRTK